MLRDLTAGTTPVSILGTAPDNSLYVAANGDVGLGTSIPQIPLHVTSQSSAGIGIERTNAQGGPQLWEIATFFNGDFVLFDRTNGTGPFAARAGAPNNGIFLDSDTAKINGGSRDYNFLVRWDSGSSLWADGGTGDIGMGTNAPTAPLHVLRNDGTAQLLIEDTGTNNGNLSMVQLTNRSGRARMQFTSVGNPNQTGDWSISSGLTFVLQERLTGQNVFIMDNQGNLNITGELTTAGSCAAGCDRVFDADYDLPSIAEHQSAMWTNGYLPNVGPTPEDGPFNVSDKMGRMLNELEHAHIFIGQQERRIAALSQDNTALHDLIAQLAARLDNLEGRTSK